MRELKVGDKVWLRDDLEEGVVGEGGYWDEGMKKGSLEKAMSVYSEEKAFCIESDIEWEYTFEMIDWDKTIATWEEQERKNNESISGRMREQIKGIQEGFEVALENVPENIRDLASEFQLFCANGGKQEKIVMPKFFDDWVKHNEEILNNDETIIECLSHGYTEDYLPSDVHEFYVENKDMCIRALLDGYEVKQEQLYTVDLGGNFGIVRNPNGGILLTCNYRIYKKDDKHLTQSEIENSDFSVLMAIADKVDM